MQLSSITLYLRERFEPRLIYSPFLRLIIFSPLFLVGFLAVLVTLIGGALYLPKMWRVSPAGFEPIVRISGLDMTQNWALKRSARKLEAAGKTKEAAEAWLGAVAQNPADLPSLHGALESCLKLTQREDRIFYSALTHMQWLLRINGTNMTDVDLIARACDRMAVYDYAAYLFQPLDKERIPDTAKAVLLKNLFHQGRIPEFAQQLEKDAAGLPDTELKFYELALTAGWKENPASAAAFSQLEKAAQSGGDNGRIGHLLLSAAAQKKEIDLFSRELDRLASRNEAKADDHALYWIVLASTGRTNEAVKLAQSATVKPGTALELVHVAQSYLALGLVDNARELLKEVAPHYARTPEIWMLYVAVLETKQDWDGIRTVARMIRQDVGVRETLWGFSYFLDGRADLAQQRTAAAKVAFDQAVNSAFDYPMVAAAVGRDLTRLNYPEQAVHLFQKIEKENENNPAFWDNYYAAALGARDAAALLKATENSYRLLPKDPARLNNYAAALLVNQTRPNEAIQLTLQLYSKFPESNAAAINHACALLLNQRAEEARALLEKVKIESLASAERSQYYLTLFETYHSLKMWARAQETRRLIAESVLFPVQRQRLHEKDKQIPAAAKAA